ncbi:hypothetical protein KIN20_006718 [Parelaphostrongylus tenuis]|uniref:RRM domain-containing protein n=1 Tax=Parelaphostrongylus tenuis TaxID=148309 RepID=A0AAD5M5B5_PARTN|nr:hypothetical protein KIN20_006718 [Parelaphostrongylus tenuis]
MDCKVYVGGLPNDATSQEIEDAFYRFGRIRKVWVARRPPGFAFVEFEDSRDAEDAVKALDGSRICGVRARVELSHGRGRGGGGGGYGGRRSSGLHSSVHPSLPLLSSSASLHHPFIITARASKLYGHGHLYSSPRFTHAI